MDKFSVEKPHDKICLYGASGNPGKLTASSVSLCDHTRGRASQICLPRIVQPVPAKIREALSSSLSLFEQDVSVFILQSVLIITLPHTSIFSTACHVSAACQALSELSWNFHSSEPWHSM